MKRAKIIIENKLSENKQKQNVARLSVASNSVLTVSKIITGLSIGSVSIISEGIHSGMDLLASLIAYFSVKKSSLPPDSDHAFGHGKYEDASGLAEALLIAVAAGIIIWEAVTKLIEGGDIVSEDLLFAGMIVMGVSALVNFFVSQRIMKVAKATDSIALESDAWHLRTDVLTSLGVFLGLILIKITGLSFLDSVIAIIVAVIILREAFVLIRRSFGDLMDESLGKDEVNKIEEIICRFKDEYINFHSLKTRKSGPNRFVEFHIMMPREMPLWKAHDLIDKIEKSIEAEIPKTDVIIHLDPCDGRCKRDVCTFVCKEK